MRSSSIPNNRTLITVSIEKSCSLLPNYKQFFIASAPKSISNFMLTGSAAPTVFCNYISPISNSIKIFRNYKKISWNYESRRPAKFGAWKFSIYRMAFLLTIVVIFGERNECESGNLIFHEKRQHLYISSSTELLIQLCCHKIMHS